MQSNVIPFPSTPPFQVLRKRGARSHAALKARITSNLPDLMPKTQGDIVRLWRYQVPMGWIAKMHQLTIPQVEAVVWMAYNGEGPVVAYGRAA